VVARWRDFPWTREIHSGDLEEIQDSRLLANVYTHGYKLEENRCFQAGGSRPYLIQAVDGLSHVFGQH
jgi:hypothetical protein